MYSAYLVVIYLLVISKHEETQGKAYIKVICCVKCSYFRSIWGFELKTRHLKTSICMLRIQQEHFCLLFSDI